MNIRDSRLPEFVGKSRPAAVPAAALVAEFAVAEPAAVQMAVAARPVVHVRAEADPQDHSIEVPPLRLGHLQFLDDRVASVASDVIPGQQAMNSGHL